MEGKAADAARLREIGRCEEARKILSHSFRPIPMTRVSTTRRHGYTIPVHQLRLYPSNESRFGTSERSVST